MFIQASRFLFRRQISATAPSVGRPGSGVGNKQFCYAVRPHFGFAKIGIWILLIVLGQVLIAQQNAWALLGILLSGIMFAHGVELQHQALHRTLLRSRLANDLSGALLGLPMVVGFHHYRYGHLRHHRNLGSASDQEFFHDGNRQEPLRAAFGLDRYARLLGDIVRSFCGLPPRDVEAGTLSVAIRREYFRFGIVALILIAIASVVPLVAGIIAVHWLVPLLLVAGPTHYLIELPEHLGCDRNDRDPRANTRTIVGTWFSRWLTNGNNFHVEHHLYPSVPIDRLAMIHRLLPRESYSYFDLSYVDFYFWLVATNFFDAGEHSNASN